MALAGETIHSGGLERIGPIAIDDFKIINDINETKRFNFELASMGKKTCIVIDWGDGSRYYLEVNYL